MYNSAGDPGNLHLYIYLCPTKLIFIFYDFSMVYYKFLKISVEINRKIKYKTVFKIGIK